MTRTELIQLLAEATGSDRKGAKMFLESTLDRGRVCALSRRP